jgi:hypothetical protein
LGVQEVLGNGLLRSTIITASVLIRVFRPVELLGPFISPACEANIHRPDFVYGIVYGTIGAGMVILAIYDSGNFMARPPITNKIIRQ